MTATTTIINEGTAMMLSFGTGLTLIFVSFFIAILLLLVIYIIKPAK